jgi:hypothetical protein
MPPFYCHRTQEATMGLERLPRGYYELEKVKKIKEDASWLPETRGKAFKMVSQLLFCLPATERYRVIFLRRDLDEILASQEKMALLPTEWVENRP